MKRSVCSGSHEMDVTGLEIYLLGDFDRIVAYAANLIPRRWAPRVTEIVGTSEEGVDAAIRNGITRAAETIRHLDWFEVTEIRGNIHDGGIAHFQVGMKVGFRLEDE